MKSKRKTTTSRAKARLVSKKPGKGTKESIRADIKKIGFKVPQLRDAKGRIRTATAKELKAFKIQAKAANEFVQTPEDRARVVKMWQATEDERRKIAKSKIPNRRVNIRKVGPGFVPKITKQPGYRYVQGGSGAAFVVADRDVMGREIEVHRQGRVTKIDTPEQMKKLINSMHGARKNYREALRKNFEKTKVKVSDVMFFAVKRIEENGVKKTIIDLDATAYGGLSTAEANQYKLL